MSKISLKEDDSNRTVQRVVDRIYEDIRKLRQDGQKTMKISDIKERYVLLLFLSKVGIYLEWILDLASKVEFADIPAPES